MTETAGGETVKILEETLSAFRQACDALAPMKRGAALLLGCSAGGDSMALLDLCAREAGERDWRLCVAHLDHAQRPESADEVRFVEERCRALGIRCIVERLHAPAGETPPTGEEAMREARHAFFRRAMREAGAQTLVLAHQADDRAETLLMRLISGSGPTGLASIRPVEQVEGLVVARPLLGLRRERLRDYLRERGLDWRDDPTNEDMRFKRAWVRREALPMLGERMGRDVAPHLVRAAELAEEESAALAEACELLLAMMIDPAEAPARESLRLTHQFWDRAGEGLRRRLMRQWLWRLRRSPYPPGYAAVEEALKFAERGEEGAELRTIEGLRLIKRGGRLTALERTR